MINPVIPTMELLNMLLNTVKKKFPKQSDRIETLYETNKDFRALCSDYLSCIQYLQKLESDVNEKQNSIKEYDDIKKDLESELKTFIFNEE
jgi:DNA repair ATPase RecN